MKTIRLDVLEGILRRETSCITPEDVDLLMKVIRHDAEAKRCETGECLCVIKGKRAVCRICGEVYRMVE